MRILVFGLALVFANAFSQTDGFKIGVHYFPGWKDNQLGSAYPLPWEKIKPFPEREPMLGWYAEGDLEIIRQQLHWMKQYGIDFVVFNWLWTGNNRPVMTHAINAYLQVAASSNMQFAIMWANHTDYIFSRSQFEALFQYWADRYMFRDDYLRFDGKPAVFIFSAETFNRNAQKIGMQSSDLVALADRIFKSSGLAGISFVGGVSGASGPAFDYSRASGYAGFSAYNYHGPATIKYANSRVLSHSYQELDTAYRDQWEWMLGHAGGTFIVPMSTGWDKRPWGGSQDPGHDDSVSTPEQFEAHLNAAKETMLKYPTKTRKTGVICCWNEFGEGSYLEPTKRYRFSYLEKVRKVFGSP
jgi:hypothetical protein